MASKKLFFQQAPSTSTNKIFGRNQNAYLLIEAAYLILLELNKKLTKFKFSVNQLTLNILLGLVDWL